MFAKRRKLLHTKQLKPERLTIRLITPSSVRKKENFLLFPVCVGATELRPESKGARNYCGNKRTAARVRVSYARRGTKSERIRYYQLLWTKQANQEPVTGMHAARDTPTAGEELRRNQ